MAQGIEDRLRALAESPTTPVEDRLRSLGRESTFTEGFAQGSLGTIAGTLSSANLSRRVTVATLKALGLDDETTRVADAFMRAMGSGAEVVAGLGERVQGVAETVPQGTPTFASNLGSAVGSAAVLAPVGLVGGPVAVGAVAGSQEASQLMSEAEAQGASPARQLAAAGLGAAVGAIEGPLGPEAALGRLGKALVGAPVPVRKTLTSAIVREMARSGAGEASEEVLQGLGEQAVRQWVIQDPRAQKDLRGWLVQFGDIWLDQGLPAGIVGMIMGGMAQAGALGLEQRRASPERAPGGAAQSEAPAVSDQIAEAAGQVIPPDAPQVAPLNAQLSGNSEQLAAGVPPLNEQLDASTSVETRQDASTAPATPTPAEGASPELAKSEIAARTDAVASPELANREEAASVAEIPGIPANDQPLAVPGDNETPASAPQVHGSPVQVNEGAEAGFESKPPEPFKATEVPKEPFSTTPPVPSAPEGQPATGIKNRTVDAELERMGLPPAEHGQARSDADVYGAAKARFEADQASGQRLVDELETAQRPATDDETALLTFEINRLINERDDADAAYLVDRSQANEARVERASAAYARAADVVTKSGTESGRAFRLRRMMLARDYSLAAMEKRAKVASGTDTLTADQTEEIRKLHAEIKVASEALERFKGEAELQRATLEAENAMLQMRKEAKPRAARGHRKERVRAEIDDLVKELASLGRQAYANPLDPKILGVVVKLAAKHLELGVYSFEEWSKAALERVGEWVEPYLREAWSKARADVDAAKVRVASNPVARAIVQLAQRQTRYQGNKREFLKENAAVLAALSRENLQDVETIFDLYAGGGTYGMTYFAAGATPNAKRIVVNEVDPLRRARLQAAIREGGDFMAEWDSNPTLRAFKERLEPLIVRSSTPAAMSMDLLKMQEEFLNLDERAKVAFLALRDVMFSGRTETWERLREMAAEDADRIKRLAQRAQARGAKVEVTGHDAFSAAAQDMVRSGGRSLVLADPAYHRTSAGAYAAGNYDFGSDEYMMASIDAARSMVIDGNVLIYHNNATQPVSAYFRAAFGAKMFQSKWTRINGQTEFLGIFDGQGQGIDAESLGRDIPAEPVTEEIDAERSVVGAPGGDSRTEPDAGTEGDSTSARRPVDVAARLEDRLRSGESLTSQRYLVNRLARQFVAEGVTETDKLIDAVHEVLRSIDPNITRSQTRDAISGYGDFKPLSADDVSRRLRDLRGQMQQLGKLEDIAKGLPPQKTGPERRTPSDEERRLIKRVHEEMRAKGIKTTDPETQLRSAIDSIAARLKHQIADLQHALDTGERIVKGERQPLTSPEIEALKKRRDEVKAEFDRVFEQQGPTKPADVARLEKEIADLESGKVNQRGERQGPDTEHVARLKAKRAELRKKLAQSLEAQAKRARSALERSIAEYERRIAVGETTTPERPAPVSTPELEVLRARRDALRDELQSLRRGPALSPEQRAIQANKTRLANELARMRERIFYGEIERPSQRLRPEPRELTADEIRLRADLQDAKNKFARLLERDRLANRTAAQKAKDVAREVLDLPRAIKASWDVSAVLRQGAFFSFGHPVQAARHVRAMLRALSSERVALEIDTALRNRDLAQFGDRAGLELTRLGDELGRHEEGIRSQFSDRIPGVRASNRAFVTFLNLQRAAMFDAMVRAVPTTPTLEQGKALANAVNVATGRGEPGRFAGAISAAGHVLWSPRLLLSRFQLLAGQPLYGGDVSTRKLIAKEYARALTGLAAVYVLATLAGSEPPEDDPTSSDFGKLKFGNTRVDPLAGLSQVTVLLSRLTSGEKKALSGRVSRIRGEIGYGRDNSYDIIARFLRTKLTPTLGVAVDLLSGENIVGEPVTPTSVALDVTIPLTFRDIDELMQDQGVPAGVALTILSAFGMGLQTIPPKSGEAEKPNAAQN